MRTKLCVVLAAAAALVTSVLSAPGAAEAASQPAASAVGAGWWHTSGNQILDVHGLSITDPAALESALNQIPGVVTVGLFAHRPADVLLIAGDSGVKQL